MTEKQKQNKKKQPKQKQKQAQIQGQKQVVNINIDSKNKKKTSKKRQQKQQQPKGRMSGEQAYRNAINSNPMVLQHIPPNNELISAIQGILNRNNAPVPVQVNTELLPKVNQNMEALLQEIRVGDSQAKQEQSFTPEPRLPIFDNVPPISVFRPVSQRGAGVIDTPRDTPISPPLSIQQELAEAGMSPKPQKKSVMNKITDSVKKNFNSSSLFGLKNPTPEPARRGRPKKDDPPLTEDEKEERKREARTRQAIRKRTEETLASGELAVVKPKGRKPKS